MTDKRLSTITEYSETCDDDLEADQSLCDSNLDVTLRNTSVAEPVEYFLLDNSPMAKFARSVKWAYKKVSKLYTNRPLA